MAEGPTDQQLPEPTSFAAFDHLLDTCRRTRGALVSIVQDDQRDDQAVRDVLAREALVHIEAILEGLIVLARTGQFSSEELRALVRRAGIIAPPRPGTPDGRAADHEAAFDATRDRGAIRAIDGRSMLAAGHARVLFSVIPNLPPEAVGWPLARRTYADIPVPRTERELLLRAEELARVVWRVAAGDERRDEALRRTLAFYEAGARMSFRGFQAA
ncbi:MAG TPA: hypothetical protein VM451_08785 [Candidatus Limnocylindria bacterium]|nr:hypothetical protein [Candidatus Limnocylindria bacterium]